VSLTVRRLEWDTDFFGFPVGEGHPVTRDEVAAVDDWATSERLRCVYLCVPSEHFPLLHAAESLGFHLMGVHVTSAACAPFAAGGSDRIVVRAFCSADVDSLERIAGDAHPDTRFFADPGFSRDSCRRLYETWIRRSTEGWADCVLVAENDESGVAGYVTLHRRGAGARIGLIAVAGETRGRGFGRALMHAAFDWCERHAINRVAVTTQAQNIAALRFYLRCGFVVDRVDFWLHKWR
jgi:dTDP-4-amino-4,6-dideoxy-D-galactose acyltransferase